MDDEILDKTLVHIDSSSVEFQGNDKWIFSTNLLEPLRDVVYIMILKTEVTLIKTKNSDQEDVFKINYNEFGKNTHGLDSYPIHIHLNDFKRHSCVVSKFASDTLTLGTDLVVKINDLVYDTANDKLSFNDETFQNLVTKTLTVATFATNNPTVYTTHDLKNAIDEIRNFVIVDDDDKIKNTINAFTNFYERVVQNESEKHIAKYFEHIPVNINNVLTTSQNILTFGNQVFATFHRNNQNVHVLNPIEPNLQRLNFELRDKYDNPIDKSDISQFNMTLCFYQNSRKLSRG
jgi:hypothetical protein